MQDLLDIKINESERLFIFRVQGQIDSARLTDLIIQGYRSNPEKWAYRRIFDYRRAIGVYDLGEVERLLSWWRTATKDVEICEHVAILTSDPLFDLRADIVNKSAKGEIRSFRDLTTATDWLNQMSPL